MDGFMNPQRSQKKQAADNQWGFIECKNESSANDGDDNDDYNLINYYYCCFTLATSCENCVDKLINCDLITCHFSSL